jgi:hypothetical protein
MLGKHTDLPTDKLVLVSRAGFTEQARDLALQSGALAISPKDVHGDAFVGKVVNNVGSLFSKLVSMTPTRTRVTVKTGPETEGSFTGFGDHMVFHADTTYLATLDDVVMGLINRNMPAIFDQFGVAAMREDLDAWFRLEIGEPRIVRDGTREPVTLRFDEVHPPEYRQLARLVVDGRVHIEVREVGLTHSRFGGAMAAYGSFTLTGRPALLVVTESEEGGAVTLRVRGEPESADEGPRVADDVI